MKDSIFVNLTVKDGELSYPLKAQETRVKNFLKNVPDGAHVEMFISVSTEKGTHAQLARVHAMIRELANEIGYTFDEMKLQVKRKAGLCFIKDGSEYCKSLAKCDKEELSLAIQACIEIGDFSGMNLR